MTRLWFQFIDYTKAFDYVDHNKLWKILESKLWRWEYQTTLPVSWETWMQDKKQQLEVDVEQLTGSKLGKDYVQAVYCHPANLTYMQSSVQFSSVAQSDSLGPHGLQHTRLPCPLPTPGACSNSCQLSQWCHPTISSSVVSFSPALNLSHYQGLFKWVSS